MFQTNLRIRAIFPVWGVSKSCGCDVWEDPSFRAETWLVSIN